MHLAYTNPKQEEPSVANTNEGTYSTHARSDFEKDIFVLKQLVTKDFKIKYRRSFLGVAWSVLNPLLMMVVMSVVFSTLLGSNIEHFPLYLILGNITYSLMSDSTSKAVTSILEAAPLLKKVKIDRFVFPVQKVLFALVNFAFSLIAVAFVMLWFRVVPTWHLIWLPVCLGLLMVFCIGIGLILSAATVFFRDVIHLWSVVLTAWNYLTPVFWDFQMLLDRGAPAWTIGIVKMNPMYGFVTFMRDIVLWQQNPSLEILALCAVWSVVMLAIGIFVFRKTEHKFILYI
ncbi:ABC transporter [Collinsella sp. An268]|nr:ABC transporter permease [Collinsella intestinalis]MBM6941573.1 ABC transporter permease [Collinsella intestinalis]OUO65374.1 ABC transporter [Collinsella sp. An268]HIU04996.1 ABC transporter permease [Candidatus Coprousia avicola]